MADVGAGRGTLSRAGSPRLPPRVRDLWGRLAVATDRAVPFDPATVAHLPGPARRWLTHAIAPGTPLTRY